MTRGLNLAAAYSVCLIHLNRKVVLLENPFIILLKIFIFSKIKKFFSKHQKQLLIGTVVNPIRLHSQKKYGSRNLRKGGRFALKPFVV